jgi:hypothetical protein
MQSLPFLVGSLTSTDKRPNLAVGMGGLEAVRMHNKPTSVGIAHRLDVKNYVGRQENRKGIYIVYDTGDKEPEMSLVSNDHGAFEVLGTVRDKKMSKMEHQIILLPNRIIGLVETTSFRTEI